MPDFTELEKTQVRLAELEEDKAYNWRKKL